MTTPFTRLKNLVTSAIKSLWMYRKYGVFSDSLRIEASSLCQLDCLLCEDDKLRKVIGKGFLRLEKLKKFLEEHPGFRRIELALTGEILLNPDLGKIMQYCHSKGIKLTATPGVNLNHASDQLLEDLVRYEFDWLVVSIDGATPETYAKYRKGGDLNRVIANIKKINEFKAKHRSPYPHMTWKFIIFGHNEHELRDARRMARELNMKFHPHFNVLSDYSPVKNKEFVSKVMGGYTSLPESIDRPGGPPDFVCRQLWRSPQLNWDGRVLGCMVNKYAPFGNAFETNLATQMKSATVKKMKRAVRGKEEASPELPCFSCGTYKRMVASGTYFDLYSSNPPPIRWVRNKVLDLAERFL